MNRWKDMVIMLLVTAGAILATMQIPIESPARQLPDEEIGPPDAVEKPPEVVKTMYGIPVSSFQIQSGEVRRGESLAALLSPHGVSLQQIHTISQLPDSLINERRIKPGNMYTVFSTSDSIPAFFVYEKDQLNYVVIALADDSIRAFNGTKPVVRGLQFASGIIENSLWESMSYLDADPMLAVELSEIFAWTIDFFGIQQGDQYKVIYEESYVDSISIGINRILGAWIHHNGTDFWAIPFIQDGTRSFFDEEGNSLRKAFLKAPLRFSRISSGFSHSRYHPVLKIRRPHHGIDYVAPAGTPVFAVGDGVITAVGYQKGGGGNYIKIKHNSVYSTSYMHLSRFGKGIRRGVYVKQGDVIGYVGSTGLSTGPHLDFRFYMNGNAVNPLRVEAPPVEPVHEENLAAYSVVRSITMQALKFL